MGWVGGSCTRPLVVQEARKALQDGRPRYLVISPDRLEAWAEREGVIRLEMTCYSGGTVEVFIEPMSLKPHLILVGRSPILEALAAMAPGAGLAYSVVDPEAEAARFPGAEEIRRQPRLEGLRLAPEAYVVIATHGHYDEMAAEEALRLGIPYVALVASPKRAGAIRDYLRGQGVEEADVDRLRSPAGLDLGAETPEEIAVSILAEIVQVRRQVQAVESLEAREEEAYAVDPVCGMRVEIATAVHTLEVDSHTFYFCCQGCKESFARERVGSETSG